MQRAQMLLVCATAGLAGIVATAQQTPPGPAPARRSTARRPAGARSPYRPAATVQDLMAGMIDPASKVVFRAVSSEVTTSGTVETAPETDGEWAVVRKNALMMVEGANLLMMPGRRIALPQFANQHNDGELAPAEIEIRVAKARGEWNKLAAEFRAAALVALKAADDRKTDDFSGANEALDTACESCHLRFWYPDQEKLLQDAPKPGQF
ncbi:MAG: hypothetical protein GEU82_05060 [Luteitalea sp.]|nr:hypothetical protein [Luteitalea sp.]